MITKMSYTNIIQMKREGKSFIESSSGNSFIKAEVVELFSK